MRLQIGKVRVNVEKFLKRPKLISVERVSTIMKIDSCVMTHESPAVSRVEDPAKRFGQVISRIDNTRNVY